VTRSALIKTFSTWERGPIDVDRHVMPEFLKLGVKDKIWFWYDPKLDPGIVRGQIEHWEYISGDGEPIVRCVDITCASQMPNDWQRIVCCKEMLHILDPEESRVSNPDQVEALVEKIILPSDLQDPFTDGLHVLSDRVAVTYATAVLFPMAAREILMAPYSVKKLSLHEIAELMEVPLRSAALVMSDLWPEIHHIMTKSHSAVGSTDRVSTLNPDSSPIEVYSVPTGVDAFLYARQLVERNRSSTRPIKRFLIESNGEKRTFSDTDLVAFPQ
jgi:hypothetical protein